MCLVGVWFNVPVNSNMYGHHGPDGQLTQPHFFPEQAYILSG